MNLKIFFFHVNIIFLAFNNLGACYEEGRGCEKNLNKAFEAYLIAAEKGDSYGWLSLSLDYKKDIFLSS